LISNENSWKLIILNLIKLLSDLNLPPQANDKADVSAKKISGEDLKLKMREKFLDFISLFVYPKRAVQGCSSGEVY
jgi:hypothetical protein